MKELIKNGADLNAKNMNGRGSIETAIEVKFFFTGKIAKRFIHTKLKELIKNGANLNAKNKRGRGPIEYAVEVKIC